MTGGQTRPSREDVTFAFAVEPLHDKATLERYLRDYPEYAGDLIDLGRELSRVAVEWTEPLSAEERAVIETAVAAQSRDLQTTRDLFAPVSVATLKAIATHLAVPRQVITAFRERRVRLDTVPGHFLSVLARELGGTLQDFRIYYLNPGPSSGAMAAYKSKVKPAVPDPVSFEQLLIEAAVPKADRERLLADDR